MSYNKSDFSYTVTSKVITVLFKNKTSSIHSDSPQYKLALSAIKLEDWDWLVKSLNPADALPLLSNDRMRVDSGQVYLKVTPTQEWPVPKDLSEQILFYMKEGLDFDPLIKFALKLRNNPSFRSVNQLFAWIKTAGLTITPEGNFVAYKGVRSDFTDDRTGTFDNSVGMVVKMPRNEVNEDPAEGCSAGLHVGEFNFAHTNYGSGRCGVTVLVEVDPANVVAVPNGETQKMRVCEYKVLSVSTEPFKGTSYSDDNYRSYSPSYDPYNLSKDEDEDEDEDDLYKDKECDDEDEDDNDGPIIVEVTFEKDEGDPHNDADLAHFAGWGRDELRDQCKVLGLVGYGKMNNIELKRFIVSNT